MRHVLIVLFAPQNTPAASIAVEFINKVALAASEPVKSEPVPPLKSETSEPAASEPVAEKTSLKPSNRDPDVKPVVTESVKKEAKAEPVAAEQAAAKDDTKENVTPVSDETSAAAVVVKTGPRDAQPKAKAAVITTTTTAAASATTTTATTASVAVKPVTAQQSTTPAAVRIESEPVTTLDKADDVVSKTLPPPVSSAPEKTIEVVAAEPVLTKVNGEIPQPPKQVAPVVVPATPATTAHPVAEAPVTEVVPVVPAVAKPVTAEDRSKAETRVFRYSRDELFEFKKLEVCQTRPAELTDDKLLRMRGAAGRGPTGPNPIDFMPSFMNDRPQGSRGARAGSSSRPMNAYGGRPSQELRNPPKKIIPAPTLTQDVKLHTTENAWKPDVGAKKEDALDEETMTNALLKNFRGLLNKITPQKYDVIEGKIKELVIDTEDRLEKVLNLVFDKAVDEPNFCKQYAHLCQHLGSRHVTKIVVKDGVETEEKVEFRRLLIQKCQSEFERDIYEGIDVENRQEDIDECLNEEKKRALAHELDEEKRRARQKSLGNMKLIGELYRLQMLKAVIMVNCIHKLISEIEDDNLECLCTLLRTIGQQLEIETQDKQPEVLAKYFQRLNAIVTSPELGKGISARVKCLIKDILDLKKNNWQGRGIHKENVPKTIDQIHKEVQIDEEKNRKEDLDYQQSRGDQRRGRPYGGQSYGSRSLQGNQHYEKDISSVLASLKATQKKVCLISLRIPAPRT